MSSTIRPSSRAEQRRKGFKKAVDADESRRKREDQMTQVRREKREESLQKKRFAESSGTAGAMSVQNDTSSVSQSTNDGGSTMESKVCMYACIGVSTLLPHSSHI